MRHLLMASVAATVLLTAVTAQAESADDRISALVDEIRRLADEAERDRAADAPFIRELRDLARRYDWPWRQTLIREDFRRGNLPESWVIDSGRFSIDPGDGLRAAASTSVAAAPNEPQEQKRSSSDTDVALAILGNLLDQVGRQQGQGQESTGETAATETVSTTSSLHVPQAITNAFAIQMTIAVQPPGGTLVLGPYQGAARDLGYRLVYAPGSDRPVELLRVGSRGSSIVDSAGGSLDTADAGEHTLLWTRDAQGQMVVSVDDRELIRVIDRGFKDAFQGLSLTIEDGTFTIADMAVDGAS